MTKLKRSLAETFIENLAKHDRYYDSLPEEEIVLLRVHHKKTTKKIKAGISKQFFMPMSEEWSITGLTL